MTIQNRFTVCLSLVFALAVSPLFYLHRGLQADCDKTGIEGTECVHTSTAICVGCWSNAGGNCQDGMVYTQARYFNLVQPGGATAVPSEGLCAIGLTCAETTTAHGSCSLLSCEGDPEELAGCASCSPVSFIPVNVAIYEFNSDGCGGA